MNPLWVVEIFEKTISNLPESSGLKCFKLKSLGNWLSTSWSPSSQSFARSNISSGSVKEKVERKGFLKLQRKIWLMKTREKNMSWLKVWYVRLHSFLIWLMKPSDEAESLSSFSELLRSLELMNDLYIFCCIGVILHRTTCSAKIEKCITTCM